MYSYSCCQPASDKSQSFASLAQLLKLMSSESRLRLLCVLQDGGEHCVCELAAHVPDMSQSLISHHLSDLKKAGLATSDKKGLRVYYRLSPAGQHATSTVLALSDELDNSAITTRRLAPGACCNQNIIPDGKRHDKGGGSMSQNINIEVVGTGCPTCKSLHEITQQAAGELGEHYEVAYVAEQDGMERLMELGLMQSPALVVNGNVAIVGYNPSLQKIKSLITDNE